MLLMYKKTPFKEIIINLLCHVAHAVVNEIMLFFCLLLLLTLIITHIHIILHILKNAFFFLQHQNVNNIAYVCKRKWYYYLFILY